MQTSARPASGLGLLDSYTPLGGNQTRLYYALREAVPIIDAAIFKTVRLTGGFEVRCADERLQDRLDNFIRNVPVGGNQFGLESFISTYFEQLLTCGTAVGEMVTDSDGHIAALFNSPLENIELRRAADGVGVDIFSASLEGMPSPVRRPELVLLSVMNPLPGEVCGCSMLKGLPFVSGILMKIYKTIGLNWERMGNVRFAVTYKPQNDTLDRAYAKERAMQVAKEWSEAMQTGGAVKDFVAVGDVQIKVIGADFRQRGARASDARADSRKNRTAAFYARPVMVIDGTYVGSAGGRAHQRNRRIPPHFNSRRRAHMPHLSASRGNALAGGGRVG